MGGGGTDRKRTFCRDEGGVMSDMRMYADFAGGWPAERSLGERGREMMSKPEDGV